MPNKKLVMMMEIAIFTSLGFILDFFSINFMPQGGGIGFKLIPLIIISYRWGASAGILGGFLMGMLDLATGITIYHWAQVFLDYFLANMVIGLVGIFRKQIQQYIKEQKRKSVLFVTSGSILITCTLKYLCHVISGVVFFGMFAEGQNVWIYSIQYNVLYSLPETILIIICMSILITAAPRLVQTKFSR